MLDIYKKIFQNSSDGMLIIQDNVFVECNQAIVDMLQYKNKDELLNTHPSVLSLKNQANGDGSFDKAEKYMELALTAGTVSFEWIHLRSNKEEFLVEVTLTNISTPSQTVILTNWREISPKALLRKKREQDFETIFNSTQFGLAIMDLESNFLEFNNAHLEFSGFTREELLQRSCIDMSIPEDIPRSIAVVKKVIKEGFVPHYEKSCINKHKVVVTVAMSLTLMPDRQRILISVRDVTEKRLMEAELKASKEILYGKANYDNLTGLPNRSLFNDRLAQSIKIAKRDEEKFALIFIDFDAFKSINDIYGHKFGDDYLQAVSEKIQKNIRDSDTLARIGGDEFTIIMNNIHENIDVQILIEKIYESIKEPLLIEETKIQVSLSMGIALYPRDTSCPELLLSYADMAMYIAKEKEKNTFSFYNEDLRKQNQHNKIVEEEIKQALLHEHFVVYYQPQINAQTNTITGVEALVRLEHPKKGLVYPAYFLNVAHSSGLIVAIDKFVMKRAMQQMKKWKEQNYAISLLSLNLSMKQIENPNCSAMFSKLLKETGCEAKWIELEITETDMMQNPEHAIKSLQHIKALGVSLAIDDFGTGYSSLSYLKRFPINRLKVDRSFINELPYNEEDVILTKTIISLAKNLHLDVIAEGVETKEQEEFLLENDCEQIQGYFYSKPIPAEEIEQKFLN